METVCSSETLVSTYKPPMALQPRRPTSTSSSLSEHQISREHYSVWLFCQHKSWLICRSYNFDNFIYSKSAAKILLAPYTVTKADCGKKQVGLGKIMPEQTISIHFTNGRSRSQWLAPLLRVLEGPDWTVGPTYRCTTAVSSGFLRLTRNILG
jgi:hypothetical protein